MIRRLYIHNFRCLENFELSISDMRSVLLIGKNGSGKTAVAVALEILQRIGRGVNRVSDLVKPKDFARGRREAPLRFEIEVDLAAGLQAKSFRYVIAFEYPAGFKELRVFEESLSVDGSPIYSRELAQVNLAKKGQQQAAKFSIDWHLVALPIVQDESNRDPLSVFKRWLAQILLLRPMPALITGDSKQETLQPNLQVTNFGEWFTGLLASFPAAYATIDRYLKQVMPDFKDIKNREVGTDYRRLIVQFSDQHETVNLPFEDLSDGEKCFMICALVLAANDNEDFAPLLCFWDEPDNYLALPEVGHFVMALRKAFQKGGQFIATSHNPEAIARFSDENTLVLSRASHLEPTRVRRLGDLGVEGDLVSALIRGDVEP